MQVSEFKNWCLSTIAVDDGIEITIEDDNHILLETEYAQGKIVFYENDIIELIVQQQDENKFYLHFQLGDEEHAMGLFNEMIDALLKIKSHRKYHVLLTCSSALTTSFFAQELNKMAEFLKDDISFSAVSFNDVYRKAIDFDMVLLAPQEAFEYDKVKSVLVDKIVLKIPTSVYAGYRTVEMIQFVKENMDTSKKVEDKIEFDIHSAFNNNLRILTMGLINHKESYRFGYRIYDHGKPTLDKEVIKGSFVHDDLIDLLDYIVARHHNIDGIGIALAGIAFHGHLYHPVYGFMNENLGIELSNRYHIPVVLINDVNAVTLGYHALNNNTENIVFYFQPVGFVAAGAGVIINDKLVTGRLHAAGEMKYDLMPQFPKGDREVETTEGALQVLCAGLRSYIATIAPDKIYFNSLMTPDVESVRNELAKYLPNEYIPELEHVYRFKKYMLPGIMIHCLEVFYGDPDWMKEYQ